jgi:hypothetical protein
MQGLLPNHGAGSHVVGAKVRPALSTIGLLPRVQRQKE